MSLSSFSCFERKHRLNAAYNKLTNLNVSNIKSFHAIMRTKDRTPRPQTTTLHAHFKPLK